MNPIDEFEQEVSDNIAKQGADEELHARTIDWIKHTAPTKYSYNFKWMGRPIIQFPQDILALQEIIWKVKPDLVIETGIAHGGSLIFSASMLALLDLTDTADSGKERKVLGVDIDIREHNRKEIESHPMSSRIEMIQGSSVSDEVVKQIKEFSDGYNNVLVILDSNHTHKHVLDELNAYSGLVSVGSYCVVFDTLVDDMPEDMFPDRPWGPADNPKTAVKEFLLNNDNFMIDSEIENKLLITVAPDGYLKRIK